MPQIKKKVPSKPETLTRSSEPSTPDFKPLSPKGFRVWGLGPKP